MLTSLFEIGKTKYNTEVYSNIVCRLIDDYLSDNSLFTLNEVVETHNLLRRLIADNINFPLAISNFDNWVFIFNSKINNFADEYLRDLIEYKYNFVSPNKIGERKNTYTENETKNGEYKTTDTSTSNSVNTTTTEGETTSNNTNTSTTKGETTSNNTNTSTTKGETTGNNTTYNSDYPNQNISKENITAYASNSVYAETETASDTTINGSDETKTTSSTTINGSDETKTTSDTTINGTDEITATNSGTRNEDINTSRERTETFNDLSPLQIYSDLLIKMSTIYPIFKNEMDILWIREF